MIKALDKTLRLALDALRYHTTQTRPINKTDEAIAALLAAIAAAESAPQAAVPAIDLAALDAAFAEEIILVSEVEYNSNKICRWFYGHLRKCLVSGAPQAAVPEGWQLVPIEPTQEMMNAAWDAMNSSFDRKEDLDILPSAIYPAMLAATTISDCAEPDRANCPRHCVDFCNQKETVAATAPAMPKDPDFPNGYWQNEYDKLQLEVGHWKCLAESHPMQECRHCGFLCAVNPDEKKNWYPLEKSAQPISSPAAKDERAAFEAWYLSEMDESATFEQDGAYYDDLDVQKAWRSWQAHAPLFPQPEQSALTDSQILKIWSDEIPSGYQSSTDICKAVRAVIAASRKDYP